MSEQHTSEDRFICWLCRFAWLCAIGICLFAMFGCELPPPPCPQFKDGQIVRHKSTGIVGYYDSIDWTPHFVSEHLGTREVSCDSMEAV